MNARFWEKKKVFLTGVTGFKGSWLALMLLRMGATIRGFALEPPTEPSLFSSAGLRNAFETIIGDIRDLDLMQKSAAEFRPEIILHLAAQPIVRESYEDPINTYSTNVMGTVHILEVVRRVDSVRVFINVTSDKCYENREWPWGYRENEAMGGYDPYSSSKGCSELITRAYYRSFFSRGGETLGPAIASGRAGNVIGGGDWARDRLVPDCIRSLGAGEPIMIRNPGAIRPWQLVLEPLAGYLTLSEVAWEKPSVASDGWNFGPVDGDARPVSWIVKQICDLWPGAANWRIDASEQPHEANFLKLDCSRARSQLRWETRTDLKTALEWIVEWYGGYYSGESPVELCMQQLKKFETLRAQDD